MESENITIQNILSAAYHLIKSDMYTTALVIEKLLEEVKRSNYKEDENGSPNSNI